MELGGEGVGLFRSEFLFMDRPDLPSEEEQFQAYKKAVETMDGRPVIIRTLDIGGDKEVPALDLEKEQNPFLGYRAIRICLDRTDLFLVQLRALLRGKVRDALQQGWGRHPQPGAGDEHDGARIGARPGGRGVVHLLHDLEDIGARGLGDALAAVDGQRNGGSRDTGPLPALYWNPGKNARGYLKVLVKR